MIHMLITAPSQIAQRQIDYFLQKNILIAGEIEDEFSQELLNYAASVHVFTAHYGVFKQLKKHQNIPCHFGDTYTENNNCNMLLLYWPKAKAEARYLLAMLLPLLKEHAEVVVVGENRSGVKSIESLFEPYGIIKKYDSARRCSFYWGQITKSLAPFEQKTWYKNYNLSVADTAFTIKALPGVFSQNALDKGTELLLKHLPKDIDTQKTIKVLDIGCGAGVIGAFLAKKYPHWQIDMIDINAFALKSSKETLAINQLTANVYASDAFSDTANDYDLIVTNPPFHSGLETHYKTTENLLALTANHQKNNAQLLVVANHFLKYQPIIDTHYSQCFIIAQNRQFVVYHAYK